MIDPPRGTIGHVLWRLWFMRSTMSPHMHAAPWCPSACSALCFGVRGPRVPWVLALAFMIRMAYIISHCVDGASQSACFECNWLLPPAGYGSGNFAGGIRTIQDGESWNWRQYVQLAWGLGAELVSTMFASFLCAGFSKFLFDWKLREHSRIQIL